MGAALTYMLARQWLAPEPSVAAAALVAFWPSHITVYTPQLHVEKTYLPLVLLTLICTVNVVRNPRWTSAAILGAVLGLSLYVRSDLALFPAALAVLLLWQWRSVRRVAGTLAIVGVIGLMLMAPWMVRNYLVFHDLVLLSTSGGYNFAISNRPDATGHGYNFNYPEGAPSHYGDKGDKRLPVDHYEMYWHAKGFGLGLRDIVNNPGAWLVVRTRVVRHLWTNDISSNELKQAHQALGSAVNKGIRVLWKFLLFLAILGLFATGWRYWSRSSAVVLPFILAYWTAFHIPLSAQPRYHMVMVPVLIILAVYAVGILWGRSDWFRRTDGDETS